MKKLKYILFFNIFAIFICLNLYSKELKSVGDIKYPPMTFLDGNIPKGYVIDILKEIDKLSEYEINLELVEWDIAKKMVLENNADIVAGLSRNPEREKFYDFSLPLLKSKVVIFVSNENFYISDINDLFDRRVGVQKGDLSAEYLRKNFPTINIYHYPNQPAGLDALNKREIDAFIGNYYSGMYWLNKSNLINKIKIINKPIIQTEYCLAVKKENYMVLDELNRCLTQMINNGKMKRIQDSWFGENYFYKTIINNNWIKYTIIILIIFIAIIFFMIVWNIILNHKIKENTKDLYEILNKLKESEERYNLAIEATNDGIWDLDLTTNQVYYSRRWKEMLGYNEDEISTSFSEWTNRIHPDDYEASLEQFNMHIEGKTPYYFCEHRLRDKEGNYKWIMSRGKALFDEKGKAYRMVGAHTDITDYKLALENLKDSLNEKEILIKEIHHRVKNNLQIISSLLSLQIMNIKDEMVINLFKESQNRIKTMALIHEKLYQNNNFNDINYKDYIDTLLTNLVRAYNIKSDNIKIKVNVDEIFLDIDKAVPLSLIINELVSNSLKYAFDEDKGGEISILLSKKEKEYNLIISDNGKGINENIDLENPKTLGLQLVNLLVKQLGGSIRYEKNNGFLVEIKFSDK